jgi:uncharacterized protein (TIGR02996 family)
MFIESEQPLLRAALERPEALELRLVLADHLLERGEPLGELLRLECGPGPVDVGRVAALRAELEPGLRRALYPCAVALGFEGGLPFCVEVDRQRLPGGASCAEPCEVPPGWVRVTGEPGFVFHVLRQPLCAQAACVDLSRARFDVAFTSFIGAPPPPVPRLPALRRLLLPDAAPPAHWRPLLGETFLDVEVVCVGSGQRALQDWLALMPGVRCIDLRGALDETPPPLLDEARRFVAAAPGRELRLRGVRVGAAQLGAALEESPRRVVPLGRDVTPLVAVEAVVVHRVLPPGERIAEATVGGERGLWLRLEGDRYADAEQVTHAARVALLAPDHPHLVRARRACLHQRHLWLQLPEGLSVLEPAPDARGALRDAVALGRALEVLGPWLERHASSALGALPVPRWGLWRAADGALRLLALPDAPFLAPDEPLAWGLPTDLTPTALAHGLAEVLVHWLTGRPRALLTAPGGALAYADWVAIERARAAPLPRGLPPGVEPLLARALSDRFEERVTLAALVEGLERLLEA